MREFNMNIDKKKLEAFNFNILSGYYDNLIIEKIMKLEEKDITDGEFNQVGIRVLLNTEIFNGNNFTDLRNLGRIIALGERDLMVKTLLNNINVITLNKDEYSPAKLRAFLGNSNAKLLISVDNKASIVKNHVWMKFLKFKNDKLTFDEHEVFPIPSKVTPHKVIILNDTHQLSWFKQVFQNNITGKKEKLDIQINPANKPGKTEVLIRSVNKFMYGKNSIKILDII